MIVHSYTDLSVRNTILQYLYGTFDPSWDFAERFREDSNDAGNSLTVGLQGFMLDGPGRYIKPSNFSIVSAFFDSAKIIEDGIYSLEQLLGLTGFEDKSAYKSIRQYPIDILSSDYDERAFVWGTTGYRIKDAVFTVEDGHRTIGSLEIVADTDNFDFEGGEGTGAINPILKNLVDPMNIGIKFNINFVGQGSIFENYSNSDYVDDSAWYSNLLSSESVWKAYLGGLESLGFVRALKYDPLTSFIEEGRNVLYGDRTADDTLDAHWPSNNVGPDPLPVVLVGGGGHDTLIGSEFSDLLFGGTGNDIIHTGRPPEEDGPLTTWDYTDTVFAGDGDDLVYARGGEALISLGAGDDKIEFSEYNRAVVWGGSGANIFSFSNSANVRLVEIPGLTEEVFSRISFEKILPRYLGGREDPITHIIINPSTDDRFFLDGKELADIIVTQDTEVKEGWDFTYEHEGQNLRVPKELTQTTEVHNTYQYALAAYNSVKIRVAFDHYSIDRLGVHFEFPQSLDGEQKVFKINGFSNGEAGIILPGYPAESQDIRDVYNREYDLLEYDDVYVQGNNENDWYQYTLTLDRPGENSGEYEWFESSLFLAASAQPYTIRIPTKIRLHADRELLEHTERLDGSLKPPEFDESRKILLPIERFVIKNGEQPAGNPAFVGSDPAERFVGSTSTRAVDYSGSTDAISVNLTTGRGTDGDATGDRYIGITKVIGTNCDDTFVGGKGDNHFVGNFGDDIFQLVETGNDTVEGGSGVDSIALSGAFSDYQWTEVADGGLRIKNSSGYTAIIYNVEQISLGDGSVLNAEQIKMDARISGTSGDDVLRSTPNDDALNGDAGDDTYVYFKGDGNDLILETNGGGVDTLDLRDLSPSDITPTQSLTNPRDIIITVNETGETITLVNTYHLNGANNHEGVQFIKFANGQIADQDTMRQYVVLRGSSANDIIVGDDTYGERIEGVAGDDQINGRGGDDTISGGRGNDILNGGEGDDTYVYLKGDGNDRITESSSNGSDTLYLQDLNAWDVTLTQSLSNPRDLIITINATGETITLANSYGENGARNSEGVQFVRLANGFVADQDTLRANAVLQGSSAADTITGDDYYGERIDGGAGNDQIDGMGGDDTINAGLGNDTITGGAGNDLFVFKPNFGLDTVTDFQAGAGSADVLEFDSNLFADFEAVLAAAAQIGDDTVITYDASNTVTLKNVALTSLHDDDVRFVA